MSKPGSVQERVFTLSEDPKVPQFQKTVESVCCSLGVGKVYSLHILSLALQARTSGPMMGGYLPSALESQDHRKEEPQLQEVC